LRSRCRLSPSSRPDQKASESTGSRIPTVRGTNAARGTQNTVGSRRSESASPAAFRGAVPPQAASGLGEGAALSVADGGTDLHRCKSCPVLLRVAPVPPIDRWHRFLGMAGFGPSAPATQMTHVRGLS